MMLSAFRLHTVEMLMMIRMTRMMILVGYLIMSVFKLRVHNVDMIMMRKMMRMIIMRMIMMRLMI
jgi:hypothetical protein